MRKPENKEKLVYVGLHPGEEGRDAGRQTPDDGSDEEYGSDEASAGGRQTPDQTEAEEEEEGAINLGANRVDHFGVEPFDLFQQWRRQARGLPRIEVPRSLTAKQFLEIQTMGAGD